MAGQYGEFVINLRRNNLNTTWGFRLQGGKEFNAYLSIQRVFNGSPADGHLQRGDVIVAVDNEDVSQWHQKQAYDRIQSIGLTLALVVRRGGSDFDASAAPPPSQAQPVASFVRKPFSQQQQQQAHTQHPQYVQQPQLSPQMTSKATLNFQPPAPSHPYAPAPPSHNSTDRENIRPAATSGVAAPWTQQHSPTPNQNSFSTPFQVRTVQQPQKAYSSYSPQQSDSFAPGNVQPYPGSQRSQATSQAAYQQEDQSGGRMPYARDSYQRDVVQSSQQPSYHEESNHVEDDRTQSSAGGGAGQDDRRGQPLHNEARKEGAGGGGGGGGGEEEEGDDYQSLTVRDIKQMFNKPDQKDVRAPVPRIKKSHVGWTKPSVEATSSPAGAYGGAAPGPPRPGQHSSLSPTRPGSIQRCPPLTDDFRKSFSPPAQPSYGQPRFASPPSVAKPTAVASINKQGGAFVGIIQPALPPKTTPAGKPAQKGQQKKKDFDPNLSAVYKILLEEEERAKNKSNQQDGEAEEEEAPKRQTQGPRQGQRNVQPQGQRQPQKQQQGSRLTELLERDAAQLAPHKKEEQPDQQEQRTPHQEQRSSYQEQRAPLQKQSSPYQEPRAPYQDQWSPYQEPRAPTYQETGSSQSYRNEVHQQPHSPARGAPGAWLGAAPAPRDSQDYNSSSFPQTQYVEGIPTSDF